MVLRAFAAYDAAGPTVLRSRTGSDLSAAFPEITSTFRLLPFSVVFDGELVVWEENRLAFGRLTQRLHRRGAAAQQAAAAQPAHYVVFDLLHVEGQSLRERPYVERRRALETLFQREGLAAPWTLCPSTNDAEVARGWLAWSVAGLEGCVFKDGGESYRPGERSSRKFRVRDTLEMIVGTVLVSIDEKTGIQAKSRRYPEQPMAQGRPARREFEYVRHGTVSIIAAMDVASGQVWAERIRRNNSATFIAFLNKLDRNIDPDLKIHLVMDNGSSHTSKATKAWL